MKTKTSKAEQASNGAGQAPLRAALRDLSQAVRLLCTWGRAVYPGSLSDELTDACERRIRSVEQVAALSE